MEKNKEKRTALTILVALTLAFIWGNSLMPGAISGAISDWFGAVLSHIFGGQVDTVHGHGVLRKLAHGTEYLVLGVELCLLLIPEQPWTALALSGVLGRLAEAGKISGISKTALVLVGDFLGGTYDRSRLYDPSFTTEFREATV